MAVLEILVYPNPELKKISPPVQEINDTERELIANLLETLDASPGCVGIAAPQVGVLTRIIIVDASRNKKCPSSQGLMVLINPNIVSQEGEVLAREGCLSLPDLTANVKRAQKISVEALNEHGETVRFEAQDFEARVILHEYDHLDGILFLDRVSSLKTDVFRRKRYAQPPGAAEPAKETTESKTV